MNLDLNLFRIFVALLEERSVTRAGARLGLSQSAVSHALGRLRRLTGDRLFLRSGAGVKPTARALEIGAQVQRPLGALQAALAPAEFDPATSHRRFTLISGVYVASVLGPELASRRAQAAPMTELALLPFGGEFLDLLDTGDADVAIAAVVNAPPRYVLEPLIREELVWAVSAASPLARATGVALTDLAATPHVVIGNSALYESAMRRGFQVRASWEDAGALQLALRLAGLSRRVAVTVPDTHAALSVVSRSAFATLVPRRLAQPWADSGWLKLIDPPYASPPVEMMLMYREDLGDSASAWFRALIRQVAVRLH